MHGTLRIESSYLTAIMSFVWSECGCQPTMAGNANPNRTF